MEGHKQYLRLILQTLREHQLYVKLPKRSGLILPFVREDFFNKLASLLTRLAQKKVEYQWIEACEQSLTVERLSNFNSILGLHFSLGCVPMHHGKVIPHTSTQLKRHEQNYLHKSLPLIFLFLSPLSPPISSSSFLYFPL
ncbi:hypothetical protein CR513_53407, partial [Mucuna pruriens]